LAEKFTPPYHGPLGECPKCRGFNTHDCENSGSPAAPCEISCAVDDPTVAHCESCGVVWCLDCDTTINTIILDNIQRDVGAHQEACVSNPRRKVILVRQTEEAATVRQMNCRICGGSVSDYYSLQTRNPRLEEAVSRAFKMKFSEIVVCSSCVGEFEKTLRRGVSQADELEVCLGPDV
jgi:hypothetical protein